MSDPLSIVQLAPISTPSSNITFPTCGVLVFLFLLGMKPKPFTPTLEPSWICTLLEIKEFLRKGGIRVYNLRGDLIHHFLVNQWIDHTLDSFTLTAPHGFPALLR